MYLSRKSRKVYHILVTGMVKFTECGWLLYINKCPLKIKGAV